jgi:pyruvate dehydrogenase E2 component (dihydrolipoamide acetyltransferase)/2-oxoisovalerate dehydrogenase E2 component (dihydrolipoyl transacylase)
MDFRLPELGEGVYEAELVSWLVKAGETVKRNQSIAEVMTDKATMEVPAPFTGTITSLNATPGQQIKVGQVILAYEGTGKIESPPAAPRAETIPAQTAAVPTSRKSSNGPPRRPRAEMPLKAAPSVRHMARKLGIDLAAVRGTGPDGRILIDDLAPHASTGKKHPPGDIAEIHPEYGTPGTRIKLQGVRRKIAEHMVVSKQTIPHYSYVDECDVTEMVRLREALREPYAKAGIKITFLAFIVKAAVGALKEVPLVNSSLDSKTDEIVLHDHYHIGIAVATPTGLIVPVIHDADRKDLSQIAHAIEHLSADARHGKVRLEDLRGGTFTVTSTGGIGGLFATPVINHPEVGILGVGKVVRRPIYDRAGHIAPADLVYLSLSFDHRVVDGAVGAAFCNAVIRRLQSPVALMLAEKGISV